MNTLQLVQEDGRRVGAELAKVQKILRDTKFPEGNLIFKRFRGYKTGMPYVRTYSASNTAEVTANTAEATGITNTCSRRKRVRDQYIPRAQRGLAKQLALKKYYVARERDLREEYAALSAFARCFRAKGQRAERLLRKYPEVYALIKDEVNDRNVKAKRWSEEAYIGKKNYADELIHETVSGQKVRSKSEVLIANELYYAGIPYRYECQQIIGGVSFYPDFTILNPRTGKVFVWEHFGLAAKREYMSDAVNKLAHYAEYGLVHGKNFIMTYESERMPLNVSTVHLMIDTYLR